MQETIDHLYVNSTRTDRLKIDFDISFPQIACNLLALDAIDETGIPQKDVTFEIFKHKLNSFGKKDGKPIKHEFLGGTMLTEKDVEKQRDEMIETAKPTPIPKGACGNCYGAGAPGECCNTCDEVKYAYKRVGWVFKTQGVAQCAEENKKMNKRDEFAEDGGCQLYGHLELNKALGGHFHVAPHKQAKTGDAGTLSLWDLIFFTFEQFNITHTINSLSFGDQFPGIKSPLDGQIRKLEDTHGMYQYYIKVVPTRYKGLNKKEIESNQYSVTEHMRHLSPGSGKGLPGLYFYYEVSPVQAIFEEKRMSNFLSFLTNVCAIVGGAFSVMGIVDVLVGYTSKYFWKDVFR